MSILTANPQTAAQELLSASSVQLHDLGAQMVGNDGRKFRYVKAGATALVPGKLQQGPAVVANHQNIAVAAAAAIGAKSLTVTLGATAATANQYSGGLMFVNDEVGEGHTYKIKSHPAADASASLVITLEDGIIVALTTASQVSLWPNPYNGVIVHPTTATNAAVGVAVYPITAAYYGWVQTYGPVACLNDGNTAVGLGVAPSGATAGAVKTMAATLSQVGYAPIAGVTTEYQPIFLTID